MIDSFPLSENLVLNTYQHEPFSRHGIRDYEAIAENANQLVQEFDVRTPGISTLAGTLSGGNQQKLVVARELGREIHLLIAAQPRVALMWFNRVHSLSDRCSARQGSGGSVGFG